MGLCGNFHQSDHHVYSRNQEVNFSHRSAFFVQRCRCNLTIPSCFYVEEIGVPHIYVRNARPLRPAVEGHGRRSNAEHSDWSAVFLPMKLGSLRLLRWPTFAAVVEYTAVLAMMHRLYTAHTVQRSAVWLPKKLVPFTIAAYAYVCVCQSCRGKWFSTHYVLSLQCCHAVRR